MSYAESGLRRMAYGGFLASAGSAPVCHHGYTTNDTLATVLGANYFDSAYARLAAGDVIFASVDMDGTPDFAILRVTASSSAGVTVADEQPGVAVAGAAAGYKIARGGGVALDGSNPTPVATGLTTIVAAFVQLRGTAAPGDNTSVLTTDFTGSDGTLNVYAWKNTSGSDPTLVASTGTETFDWFAVGT